MKKLMASSESTRRSVRPQGDPLDFLMAEEVTLEQLESTFAVLSKGLRKRMKSVGTGVRLAGYRRVDRRGPSGRPQRHGLERTLLTNRFQLTAI